PPVLDETFEARPRDLVFVVDESCSMQGRPFDAARATILRALRGMGPNDTFNLVRFDDEASALYEASRRSTSETRAAARAWLDVFSGGGTDMDKGIVRALTLPARPEAL